MTRQAGAIVVRPSGAEPEILLVRARKNPQHWIFPKGHQETGETLAETAVRELREEAGVIGEPVKPVGVSTFRSGDESVEVTYFLIRYTGTATFAEREARWIRLSDARALLSFDDARHHLDTVRQLLQGNT